MVSTRCALRLQLTRWRPICIFGCSWLTDRRVSVQSKHALHCVSVRGEEDWQETMTSVLSDFVLASAWEECISWFYCQGHMSAVWRNIREPSTRRTPLICRIHLISFPTAAQHASAPRFPHPSCTPSATRPISQALVLSRLMASLQRI